MKTKSKLERLPAAVKAELIEKLLTTSGNYDDIAQWLYEAHNQKHSKSAIWRFAQAVRLMHDGLLDLGISPTTLSANAGKLEKLGAYLVQRELLNRRIDALQKMIFDDPPVTEN
jgi:hypothetical protein